MNLEVLMTEVFNLISSLSSPINLFAFHGNTHNIENFQVMANENKKTVR